MQEIVLGDATPQEIAALTVRAAVPEASVLERATAIVDSVRINGDPALADAARRFGGGHARIDGAELAAARQSVGADVVAAIEVAASNVRAVHELQRPSGHRIEVVPGVQVERIWSPLRRIGAYVPGGTAPLPSTLVMTVVPAQVAGVKEIAVATPARANGTVDPVVLAAAHVLGVTEVYAMGGAQAVAALAHGTRSVRAVDKIVGPGNAWVTAAKLVVAGWCAIDMPAGPSEALVLADASADPRFVAADLLAQAEHGPDSPIVLVAVGSGVAGSVLAALDQLMARLSRRAVIEKALTDLGMVAIAADVDEAIEFADAWAPEHLSLHLEDAAAAVVGITSAGSVFVGRWAPEPVGDYASGANHVLPTGGLARSMNPLGTEDFGSWRQVQTLTRDGLASLRPTVVALAEAEGLDAHRLAVEIRFEDTQ